MTNNTKTSISEFVKKLEEKGICVKHENGKIQCLTPTNIGLAEEDKCFLQTHKKAIIDYLNKKNALGKIENIFHLTPLQEGMLFHDIYEPDSDQYHILLTWKYQGKLDKNLLHDAWRAVIKSHQVLRTRFVWENVEHPLQLVHQDAEMPWFESDWRLYQKEAKAVELEKLIQNQRKKKINLSNPCGMHLTLIRLEDDLYQCIWVCHHILLDGWSLPVLFQQIHDYYEKKLRIASLQLVGAPSYADYLKWLVNKPKKIGLAFWQKHLSDFEETTTVGLNNGQQDIHKEVSNLNHYVLNISVEDGSKIKKIAKHYQITQNTVYQLTWALLLSIISRTSDILYGTVVSGRPTDIFSVEKIVGLFINTLPVRIKIDWNKNLSSMLQEMYQYLQEANEYSYISLSEIKSLTLLAKDKPLFCSLFVFENYPKPDGAINTVGDLGLMDFCSHEKTNYPLTIAVITAENTKIDFAYDADRFSAKTIDQFACLYQNILCQLFENPEQKASELSLICEAEKELLASWNKTERRFPYDKTVIELFEEQVAKKSAQIALAFQDESLTFGELNRKANRLARYLREEHVKRKKTSLQPDTLVGVFLERNIETLIVILAILKAGGAYAAIDLSYPDERIAYMLNDAGIDIVFSRSHLVAGRDFIKNDKHTVLFLDELSETVKTFSDENLTSINTVQDVAYIIYTSGSTGQPKGTLIENRSIVNLVKNANYFSPNEITVIAQAATISFDASTFEIWGALLNGASCHIVPKDTILNLELFSRYLRHYKITDLFLTTALFNEIVQEKSDLLCGLKNVYFGGEAARSEIVKKLLAETVATDLKINHVYGPTEATTFATSFAVIALVESAQTVAIGKPITGVTCYVLDSQLRRVPIGIVGELYIGGYGLARGYLNQPELTAAKFIANPFLSEENCLNNNSVSREKRIYKTGDLVRWREDGNLEFVGRADQQIKLRGFRIELSEIENILSQHENIKENVVVLAGDKAQQYLAAYYVPVKAVKGFDEVLRKYLQAKLPDYMLPSIFIVMEQLPTNINGKIDKNALPKPQRSGANFQDACILPRTQEEEILSMIWMKVLKLDRVSVKSNFFTLGGDSIISIQIVSRAREAGLQLSVKDIFTYPTIEQLARVAKCAITEAVTEQVNGEVPLTPIQAWFLAQDHADMHYFNQASTFIANESLEVGILQQALDIIIKYHDALRLRFEKRESKWTQYYAEIAEAYHVKVEEFSINADSSDTFNSRLEEICNDLQSSLNLREGPMVRVALISGYPDCKQRLFITIHHLVIDSVSWRILCEDLQSIYRQLKNSQTVQLPVKTSSFQAWSQALAIYAKTAALEDERKYWLEISSSLPDFPGEDATKAVNITDINYVMLELSASDTENLLHKVSIAYSTQINDILLSGLSLGLYQWRGIEDVMIHLEGHGREECIAAVDVSRTIGWFTSIFPVRLKSNFKELGTHIQVIKETLRKIPNKGIGYGVLRYLTQDNQGNSIANGDHAKISFNYLGQIENVIDAESLLSAEGTLQAVGSSVSMKNKESHLFNINALISSGKLKVYLAYSTKHFEKTEVENFAKHFKESLELIISHCCEVKTPCHTVSDFPLADIHQDFLDTLKHQSFEDIYGLAPLQAGMLFHALYSPQADLYHTQLNWIFKKIDRKQFKRAWEILINKYAILRTGFIAQDYQKPVQIVYSDTTLDWVEQDWRDLSDELQRAQIDNYLEKQRKRNFDFIFGKLMRFDIILLSEEKMLFSWTHHHILIDGWSLAILVNDLMQIYLSLEGKTKKQNINDLFAPPPPYKDYIFWLQRQNVEEASSFWKKYLSEFDAPTPLNINKAPLDVHRSIAQLAISELHLSQLLSQQIESFAKSHQVTANIVFQLAWAKLLSVYSGKKDVLFGVTVSGRPGELKDVEKMVGLFINTLPLRVKFDDEITVNTQLFELHKTMQKINDFGYLDLIKIQKVSDVRGGQALFYSLFVFENYPVDQSIEANSKILDVELCKSYEKTNYPLSVIIIPGESFVVRIAYDNEIFDAEIIDALLQHLRQVLQNILLSSASKLSEIDLLSKAEKEEFLNFNTEDFFQRQKYTSLVAWFEAQVDNFGERIAINFNEESLSYSMLNARANQLAHYLRKRYEKKHGYPLPSGTLIGLCVERSLNTIIGILAILKVGGAYVPLDPVLPEERLAFILNDAKAPLFLTQKNILSNFSRFEAELHEILLLDQEADAINKCSVDNLNVAIFPDDSCYVIYTSGTTGKPKGVLISHKNVVRLFASTEKLYSFNENDIWTLFHSYAFDFSVWELWGALLYGGSVVIVPNDVARNPQLYWQLLQAKKITVLNQTPSAFKQLSAFDATCVRKLETLRYVIFGGESLTKGHIDLWVRKNGLKNPLLINMYGITEITVHGTYHFIREAEFSGRCQNISIGKRLGDLSLYVLSPDKQLIPKGIPGELYVGGSGVAIGYLNRTELTKERFIENPFLAENFKSGNETLHFETKIYKTGDLVKWLPDGNLEYIGRCDEQVKIRGFRIELGEIESQIKTYSGVNDAVILVRRDISGNDYLCAYIESSDFSDAKIAEIRDYLKKQLPLYMIPAKFIVLSKIPLNQNGKVDKEKLLALSETIYEKENGNSVSNTNVVEKTITAVFEKLLGQKNINIYDNFFDIGMHSLMLIQAVSILNKELDAQLTPTDLFTYTSISGLANYIAAQDGAVKHTDNSNASDPAINDSLDHNIAIIGISCRYPQINSLDDFWQVLASGTEAIKHFSDEELLQAGVAPELIHNSNYVKSRGVIDNIDAFDAKFFNYSPAEAAVLDPQHRIFLEEVWAALENAGCAPSKYSGRIGVYAGASDSSYLLDHIMQNDEQKNYDPYQILLGTSPGTLTTKVSYKLNLTGPSLNINTACSTSLVAVATACRALRNRDCDVAIAGGVAISLPQISGYLYHEGGISSPDGHCRAFDAKAQGTVPSSGVGVVVLKRLSDALKDRDHIDAVIIGAAINNDGANKVGYTAPSVFGQSSCIRNALYDAKIDAATVGYIEAHGTGTPLGDPIEITALKEQYAVHEQTPRFIGSVKTNIGHTDAAAGIAGLIKATLLLKHKKLVPSLHFKIFNPKVALDGRSFQVNTILQDWNNADMYPRRAAVSSFGIGGTNAHIILEEAPQIISDNPRRELHLLPLSAKTAQALMLRAQDLMDFLSSRDFSEKDFADVAYTLQMGRENFAYREVIVAANAQDAVSQLEKFCQQKKSISAFALPPQQQALAFVFSGQGEQYVDMGLELYQSEVVFKRAVEECCDIFQAEMQFNLKDILYPALEKREAANALLNETQYTQPALFVIEYATVKLLRSFGISAQFMIGHSLGEYVAAYFAGVFSLADALKIVARRAQLMSQAARGDMLAVSLSEDLVRPFLNNSVAIAVINAPDLLVISGNSDAMVSVQKKILDKYPDTKIQKVRTSHAFHSCLMDSILDSFREFLFGCQFEAVQTPFVSNLTGKIFAKGSVLDADYWVRHLRQTVRFSDGLKTLCDNGVTIFVRIGPGASLHTVLQPYKKEVVAINTLPQIKAAQELRQNAAQSFFDAVGRLSMLGAAINWELFWSEEKRQKLALPTYPFAKTRFWLEPNCDKINVSKVEAFKSIDDWFYTPSWERIIALKNIYSQQSEIPEAHTEQWLIFDNQSEFAKLLIKNGIIKTTNTSVVRRGSKFKKIAARIFAINPNDKENYAMLFDSLNCNAKLHILYFWELSNLHSKSDLCWQRQDVFEFDSMLLLVQACCAKMSRSISIDFSVFANNTFKVLESDFVDPRKSLLIGLCRVLPLEQENIRMNFFDVDESINNHLTSIITFSEAGNNALYASRAGYLWKEKFIKTKFPVWKNNRMLLQKNRIYLITGGLGGIGLALAEYLARDFQAKLILVSRTEFPAKHAWKEYLINHPKNDEISEKIIKLQRFLYYGSEVDIRHADISSNEEVQHLLEYCISRYGHIDGVVHAAGVPGGGFILLKEIQGANKVLAPKVQGTLNLARALHKYPLDFFVMCSALTSCIGIPGQADYSSANAFLDAVAQANIFHPCTFVATINWNAWRDAGMAIKGVTDLELQSLALGNNISSEEGQMIFAKILQQKYAQVLVSLYDIHSYQTNIWNLSLNSHDNLQIGEHKSFGKIEDQLVALFQQLLGIDVDQLGYDSDFFDLGGHSLLALKLISEIKRIFQVKITISDIYQLKTIAALARVIKNPSDNSNPVSIVVPIKKEGEHPPLFLIHPIGGTVFPYIKLAKYIDNNLLIYALQDPGLQFREYFFDTFENLAAHYLRAIKLVQPQGPYFLGGWSYGGGVAFAITKQLEQNGEKVSFLGLIDSWREFSDVLKDKNYLKTMLLSQKKTLNFAGEQEHALNADRWFDLQWHRMELFAAYSSEKINTAISLFKADELMPEYMQGNEASNHWQKYSAAPIKIYKVPGNHQTMMEEPNIKVLAEVFSRSLQELSCEIRTSIPL